MNYAYSFGKVLVKQRCTTGSAVPLNLCSLPYELFHLTYQIVDGLQQTHRALTGYKAAAKATAATATAATAATAATGTATATATAAATAVTNLRPRGLVDLN